MIINDATGVGRIEVTTVPMPPFAKELSATYTYSGRVLVLFRKTDDPSASDFWNVAVVNDDGTDFRTIFSGVIPQHEKANGIRHMPFRDNKRVLLGDYVLECDPDIDRCHRARLVPVRYPWAIEREPHTTRHWSEVIIAPDNERIAWTMLRTDNDAGTAAANAIGTLRRRRRRYTIVRPQIISTLRPFETERNRADYVVPQILRGGEVKQFVRGGTAISLVGKKDGAITDSVVQDLTSYEITQITRAPGYDETTIFSPDEHLGIVMTTRGSRATDPAIFGLVPRPHTYATQSLIMHLYLYAVAGVRKFRHGNIGPVLIEVERSLNEPRYHGVQLNDPDDAWVYVSPMSWHPSGRRAMWPEMVRGSDETAGGRQMRVRVATLHDYQSGAAVGVQETPNDIPYGVKGVKAILALWRPRVPYLEGKIAGSHAGYVEYSRRGVVQSRYVNYSDDGTTFYNGFERMKSSFTEESVYEADLEMTGGDEGAMKLRATFSPVASDHPPRLLFDTADDGKPKSHGYASHGDVSLKIDDMVE